MVGKGDAKAWARERVKGLWTTPMIPMLPDGAVDYDGIRHNVEYMLALKADGLGIGFSEPWYLTIAERMEVFKVFIDSAAGRVPVYIHAVDYSVPETVNLIRYVGELGADAVMLWLPMEFAKSEETAVDWFEYVASQVELPIFAYNTWHSGRNLSIPALSRIAEVENVCALKDAVNDFGHTVEALNTFGDRIVVSNPLEDYLPAMLTYTTQQVLLGTTSVFLMQSPRRQPIREYVDLISAGRVAEGWERYYALKKLRDVWTSTYEVLWDQKAAAHPIPTLKYWMDLVGMRGGTVRPPLHPLDDAARAAFRTRLEASGWMDELLEPAAV